MGIMVRDGLPVIMVAVGHNRIAVIQAFFDQVDFIAALGTHLMFPETAIGIERKTQYISVTQPTDLGRNAALVCERIIRRDRAVWEQPNDLPQIHRDRKRTSLKSTHYCETRML